MSDRVAVMSHGGIEQLDTPRAIYDRPLAELVADFIGDMNFLEDKRSGKRRGRYAMIPGGCRRARRGNPAGDVIVRVGIHPERIIIDAGGDTGTPTAPAARC